MIRMPTIWLMLAHYFQWDERQTRAVWLGLVHSTRSAPVAWRSALLHYERAASGHRTVDSIFAFLQAACPPQKTVEELEMLVRERQLTRRLAVGVEEKVLARITANGEWK